jgi:hypothetical protein
VSEDSLGEIINVGSVTVRPSLAVAVAEPLVAFTVIVPVPAAAAVVVVTVAVALAPGFTLAGLKLTVTPVGAVADRVTAFVKLLAAPTATVKVVDCPWNVVTEEAPGVTVNDGDDTVSPSLSVGVYVPLVPLITIVLDPTATVLATVTVTVVLVPVFTLAGLMLTVTPVGAVAFSATVPV